MDYFKEYFKYYKSNKPPPDLKQPINLLNKNILNVDAVRQISSKYVYLESYFSLIPIKEWQIYEIVYHPGLFYIQNPFTGIGQRYWIAKCLQEYTKKPNKLNIDAHDLLQSNEDWWSVCNSSKDVKFKTVLQKLRWATLGYHHNWDTKIYSEDSKDEFPSELNDLCKYLADALGFNDFKAQAAIVNFYHMDSTLSGHTDHSESNLEAPLFSLSFGQSAIFLIGGTTKDVVPTPIFVHSGDILIMSQQSRLCYHGVPKILPAPFTPWKNIDDTANVAPVNEELYFKCKDENFWKPFNEYIQSSRINLNIRQVLHANENILINQGNVLKDFYFLSS